MSSYNAVCCYNESLDSLGSFESEGGLGWPRSCALKGEEGPPAASRPVQLCGSIIEALYVGWPGCPRS